MRRVLVAWVAVAVAMAASLLPPRPPTLRADAPHPSQDGAYCRATGRVVLVHKLVCAQEHVEVRLVIDPICGDGADAGAIRHLRVSHDLPPGIVSVAGSEQCQTDPGQLTHWSTDLPTQSAAHIEIGHIIEPIQPGVYELGGASVEITDRTGAIWTTPLTPATLVVAACGSLPEERPQPIYLPYTASPGCPAASRPTDLALVIDRSASMDGGGLSDAVRQATGFMQQLDPAIDRVAVLGFDSQVDVLAPLTNDRSQVAAALSGLEMRQGTRIDRALSVAVELLRAGDPSGIRQRAILLLTDGVQIGPGGDGPVLEAARVARAAHVRIWAIGLGPGPNQSLLRAIADRAPGLIASGDANRLDDVMHDAVAALRCGR